VLRRDCSTSTSPFFLLCVVAVFYQNYDCYQDEKSRCFTRLYNLHAGSTSSTSSIIPLNVYHVRACVSFIGANVSTMHKKCDLMSTPVAALNALGWSDESCMAHTIHSHPTSSRGTKPKHQRTSMSLLDSISSSSCFPNPLHLCLHEGDRRLRAPACGLQTRLPVVLVAGSDAAPPKDGV